MVALDPRAGGPVGRLFRGELCALWLPGLWHLLVSEVSGGAGGGAAEAVGAGAWDLGGGHEVEDVRTEVGGVEVYLDGAVLDGLEGAEDGVGAAEDEVEQEVGA